MSSDFLTISLPLLLMVGLTDAILLYATYLSLTVWRGLAVPEFRSRALWMALFGIPVATALAYGVTSYTILPTDSLFSAPAISESIFTLGLVALFIWIDRMVRIAIRMDYLRRDILQWRRLRLVYYVFFVVANIFYFARYFVNLSGVMVVAEAALVIPLLYGISALIIGARNTRDLTFKGHVRWFGYMGAAITPVLVIYTQAGHPTVLLGIPLILVAFCFYKMARNLVPIGKL